MSQNDTTLPLPSPTPIHMGVRIVKRGQKERNAVEWKKFLVSTVQACIPHSQVPHKFISLPVGSEQGMNFIHNMRNK